MNSINAKFYKKKKKKKEKKVCKIEFNNYSENDRFFF